REIDVLPSVQITPEKAQFLEFSRPHLHVPLAVVTRTSRPFMRDVADLNGERIAVVKSDAPADILRKQFPELKLIEYEDLRAVLEAVAAEEVDAAVDNLPVISYLATKSGFHNLKIALVTEDGLDLAFGVRKDWELLPGIIDKALTRITPAERDELYRKWVTLKVEPQREYGPLLRVLLAAVVVIILIFFWNRRLAQEISRRKEAEAELRIARDVANSATRAKSEFLADMGHEIRTPLNAIMGFSELLEERAEDATAKEYLKAINSNSRSLLKLLNDLLDLSKIEAGRLELQPEPTDLRCVIEEIRRIFSVAAGKKGVEIAAKVDAGFPDRVLLDETRIRQVLSNIIGNAVKFTDHGTIELKVVLPGPCTDGARAAGTRTDGSRADGTCADVVDFVIEIADTGTGFDSAKTDIFAPFVQAPQDAARGGTGLGLSICKRLVESMGGTISVQSAPSKGSVFRVTLHGIRVCAPVAREKTSAAGVPVLSPGSGRILVVDDAPDNRALVKAILARFPSVEVVEAKNGDEAIALCEAIRPDLVLSDMRMPGRDGVSMARELRARESFRGMPIVCMTASVEPEIVGKNEGLFDAEIRKPMSRHELIEIVARFLSPSGATATSRIPAGSPDALSADERNNLAERFGGVWRKIRGTSALHDVENFARELGVYAESRKIPFASEWSRKILAAISVYDIAEMNRLLKEYGRMTGAEEI
ncbi:MAG: transporter substrate-binding domain-containing protein, partial [Candidatus Hydrogenedentota bacterium]